jgi:hypothetical protein
MSEVESVNYIFRSEFNKRTRSLYIDLYDRHTDLLEEFTDLESAFEKKSQQFDNLYKVHQHLKKFHIENLKDFECSVCFGKHEPQMLSCGHTICMNCCLKIKHVYNEGNDHSCPICRGKI